jgi:hypothetical protein
MFVIVGSIPMSVWNSLSENSKDELTIGYANAYLGERDYCAEVIINVYYPEEGNKNMVIEAICNKVKI